MNCSVAIDFCCNDPDNGTFAGRVGAIQIGARSERELEVIGRDFAFTAGGGWVRIHRRKFEFVSSKEYFGNWCWNRYVFDHREAIRLINTLRDAGWHCTTGPSRWFEWFNREGQFAGGVARG